MRLNLNGANVKKNYSFKASERIKRRGDIVGVLREGKRWQCNGYSIIYKENANTYDRFGVLVSKKVGNAVRRNFLKRLFREMLRLEKSSNPPFFDILIKIHPGTPIQHKQEIVGCYRRWHKKLKKFMQNYSSY
jgi:ribonuclease P protein component